MDEREEMVLHKLAFPCDHDWEYDWSEAHQWCTICNIQKVNMNYERGGDEKWEYFFWADIEDRYNDALTEICRQITMDT